MSYFAPEGKFFTRAAMSVPYASPMAGVTVTQTPGFASDGSLLPVAPNPNQAACLSIGGRWLSTFGGSYCEGSDGKTVPAADLALVSQSEAITVTGKAPPLKKKFPWKPVLIGVGALAVVLILTKKKGGAGAPAPVLAT